MRYAKTLTFIILLFICIPIAFSTDALQSADYWTNFQCDEEGTGQTTAQGFFNSSSDEASSSYISDGNIFQPLTYDLNSDNVLDIIGGDSDTIKIWKVDSQTQTLVLQDEYDAGGTQDAQHSIATTDNGTRVIMIHGNIIYVYSFNASDKITIDKKYNLTLHRGVVPVTGIKCTSGTTPDSCYFGTNNKTIIEYVPNTNATDQFSVENQTNTELALADIDNDNYIEVMFGGDDGTDDNICCYDLNSQSKEFCKDLTGTSKAKHVTTYNIDGSGYSEVVVAHGTTTTAYLQVFDKSGNTEYATTIRNFGGGTQTNVSLPITGTFRSDRQICVAAENAFNPSIGIISCYNASDGALDWYNSDEYYPKAIDCTGENIISVDIDSDGYEDIVTPYQVWYPKRDTSTYWNLTTSTGGMVIVADTDGDSSPEIIGQRNNYVYAIFSSYDNEAPVLNGNRTFGITPYYLNSICPGTTVTFSATECGLEPCHYYNDAEVDTERLASTCGTNTTRTNGTYSTANPTLSCYYYDLGTYVFKIYLQDSLNDDDITQFQSFVVSVVNGTPGETCNIPISTAGAVGSTTTPGVDDAYTSETEIQYVVDTLTGQSAFLEALMAIIFTVGALYGMLKMQVKTPLIYAVGIFALWIGFAMIGIMSWVYVMLFAFVMLLVTGVALAYGGGN